MSVNDESIDVVVVRATSPIGACGAGVIARDRAFGVHLVDTHRQGSREVLLRGTDALRVTGVVAPAAAQVRVHRPPDAASQLTATSDEQVTPLVDGDDGGCGLLTTPDPGRYEIAPTDPASHLIGPTHLLLAEHPVGITVDGRSVDRDLHVVAAALLTVHLDPAGGRLPDVASTGTLLWTVRGDDARIALPPGGTRPLHPGEVTIVVSACSSAETAGSPTRITLAAGEVRDAAVSLATVTLDGIGSRSGWTLHASRFTECFDGSTRRPSLSWVGGLHDGMRIALPRGLWQLFLTSPGMPDSPRVLVPVGGPDLTVVMR